MRRGLAVALAAALAGGCGGGKLEPQTLPGPSEQLLTQKDVDRYRVGTPAHALMLWWHNAQYANETAFVQSYTERMRSKLEANPRKTRAALSYFSGSIRTGRPSITDTVINDRFATVYALIAFRQPVGSTRYITSTVPRAFAMARESGEWRLRDDFLLQEHLSPDLRF